MGAAARAARDPRLRAAAAFLLQPGRRRRSRARPRLWRRRVHGRARRRRASIRSGSRSPRPRCGASATRHPGLDFRLAPIDGPLPFEDNRFALVWASEVIEHVADTARWLSEVRRVLGPAGPPAADDALARPAAAGALRRRAVLRAARRSPAPVHAPVAVGAAGRVRVRRRGACGRPAARRCCAGCCWPGRSGELVRVLIDTTYARRAPYSGTGIYIDRLCAELAREVASVEVVEAANRAPAPAGRRRARQRPQPRRRPLVDGGRAAAGWPRGRGADVIHHPLPALAPVARLPQVVTVLDLAFERLPDCFDRGLSHLRAPDPSRGRPARRRGDLRQRDDRRRRPRAVGRRRPSGSSSPTSGRARSSTPVRRPARPAHFLYVGRRRAAQEPGRAARRPTRATASRSASRSRWSWPGRRAGSRARGARRAPRPRPQRLAELYAGAVALVHPSLLRGLRPDPARGDAARHAGARRAAPPA